MRPVVLLAVLLPAAALAAAPAKDAWTRVPAFPTACYQSDGYADKVAAADEAVTRDRDAQKEINQELQEKIKTIDPMELASRQQQYMMDHPQEAMALMQRNQALGETYTDDVLAYTEEKKKLDQELAGVDSRYQAALDKMLAPVRQKFKDLDVRAEPHLVAVGEVGYDYPPWAVKEWNALTLEENAVYEKACAEWWASSGPYHLWLKSYRDHLVRQIPKTEEAEHVGAGFMVQMVGTPTRAFKPTATLTAVHEYMDQAAKVFGKRRTEPNATREGGIRLGPHGK